MTFNWLNLFVIISRVYDVNHQLVVDSVSLVVDYIK